jgi:hypothetical protein
MPKFSDSRRVPKVFSEPDISGFQPDGFTKTGGTDYILKSSWFLFRLASAAVT